MVSWTNQSRAAIDKRWVVVVEESGLWVWDTNAVGSNPVQLLGPKGFVNGISLSGDGYHLSAADSLGQLWIWNLTDKNAGPIFTSAHPRTSHRLAFGGNGHWLITTGDNAEIRFWPMDWGDLVDLAAKTAGRNFSSAEWQSFFPAKPYRPTFPGFPQPEQP